MISKEYAEKTIESLCRKPQKKSNILECSNCIQDCNMIKQNLEDIDRMN